MTKELFEKAKFGDRFVTRGGQEALFLRLTENSEWQFADFYVKDWGQIRVNRENGKCLNGPDIENDIVGMMPSLPSDLDEAAETFNRKDAARMWDYEDKTEGEIVEAAFIAGAQWRDAQIPKLPNSIDEAAEEYAYNNWEDNDYHTGASEGLPFDAIGHTERCFKAGAEWMAAYIGHSKND